VPEAEVREDLTSPWFLFNDFVVNNITEDEALSFPGQWKVNNWHVTFSQSINMRVQVPAIIYLERSDTKSILDFTQLPCRVDASILYQDTSIALFVLSFNLLQTFVS
jgi:PAB-dependent poly(A)-specific ribonuclease subunit 2